MKNGKFRSGHTVAEIETLMEDVKVDGIVDNGSGGYDQHARAAALLTVENAGSQLQCWADKQRAA